MVADANLQYRSKMLILKIENLKVEKLRERTEPIYLLQDYNYRQNGKGSSINDDKILGHGFFDSGTRDLVIKSLMIVKGVLNTS